MMDDNFEPDGIPLLEPCTLRRTGKGKQRSMSMARSSASLLPG